MGLQPALAANVVLFIGGQINPQGLAKSTWQILQGLPYLGFVVAGVWQGREQGYL